MSRTCPGCNAAMHVFLAKTIEIDCCLACGSSWFDYGELEQVVHKAVQEAPLNKVTEHRCPVCRLTLSPVYLAGGVPAEACTSCRGLYLGERELESLADGHVGMTAKDPRAWKKLVPSTLTPKPGDYVKGGFLCLKCGKPFPMSHANQMSGKLACRDCVPEMHLSAAARADANASHVTSVHGEALVTDDDVNVFAALRDLWRGLRQKK